MPNNSTHAFSSKRIAKNAIFLYMRMIITVVVSFYTARILLQELGVDNYGIYNLVGGIVLLFASLRGMFSCAVQRYLNYEYAREGGNAQKVFSLSLIIHILVTIIFVIAVEVTGYFVLPSLNIPTDRLFAAKIVFQFSILASGISILTIPYDAVIVAREKMDIYAYIAIFEAFGKLLIVILIPLLPYDILINYGLLVLLISLMICFIYYVYCVSHFAESKFKWQWDTQLFKELSGFAGWNFVGNLAFSLTNEGINMLLNFFGGVAVNAARGISYQIKNILQQLLGNIMTAYRPQSTVSYAQKQYDQFYKLLFQSSKVVFALYCIMVVPLFIFLPQILQIWLNQVPEYTVSLMRAIFIYMMVRSFHEPMDLVFKSAGKLNRYQLCELCLLTLSLPLSYLILKTEQPFYFVFIGMAVVEFINLVAIVTIARYQLGFPFHLYIKKVQGPCCVLVIFLVLIHCGIGYIFKMPENMYLVALYMIIDVMIVGAIIYFIQLNKEEKKIVKKILRKILHN